MARILLIEDGLDFADFVSAVLSLNGHTVTHATTVRDGVAAAQQALPPELVLLDLTLPDGTGLDFLSQVTLAAPVVVLTASIDAETRQQLLAQGLRFVIKPLTARELIELVTTTLAKGYAYDLNFARNSAHRHFVDAQIFGRNSGHQLKF